MKRLLKELNDCAKDNNPDIKLYFDDDIYNLKARINGMKDSPYEQGIFDLEIKISEEYPLHPPKIKFLTTICHPNINFETGEICLDLLSEKWSPSWTLVSALEAIRMLLVVFILIRSQNHCPH